MQEETKLTVYNLEPDKVATIINVTADAIIRQRLFDMGILPNNQIVKMRTALGGDPVWVNVQGIEIALRKNETEAIEVKI